MQQLEYRKQVWDIPESDSPCDAWKTYLQKLERAFGKRHAREIWLLTWQQNGSATCTMNAQFNQWLKRKGIDVSNAATRAIASSGKLVDNVLSMGANAAALLRVGVPVALVLIVSLIGYGAYRSIRNGGIGAIANAVPVGRVAKLAMG